MRIIKQIETSIDIKNKPYPVLIVYKYGKKNITYRFKENKFIITTPVSANKKTIQDGLVKFAPRLLTTANEKPVLWADDYIYIFGSRFELRNNSLALPDKTELNFKDNLELENKLKKWFLIYVKELTYFYKKEMKITEPLNIKVRKMKTRYGSYSRKTKTIYISLELIHYNLEMTKAVVVHELSHYYVFDHSQKFYKLVLSYYPNYYDIHTKLRKGILN